MEESPKDKKTGSPEEIISSADTPVTHNSQLVTEQNMELHHHSHAQEKKNWKSYFWEFLMLFPAVYCWFL